MVETEFFLELLMRLLTNPSGLDSGGERLERRIGGQVRSVVFPLAGRPAFTDQPDLLVTRHGLHTAICHAVLVAIGDPDAGSGELAMRSAEPASVLRRNVTSPNGTTQAALEVLMAGDGMQPLFDRAIAAATARSRQLAG